MTAFFQAPHPGIKPKQDEMAVQRERSLHQAHPKIGQAVKPAERQSSESDTPPYDYVTLSLLMLLYE